VGTLANKPTETEAHLQHAKVLLAKKIDTKKEGQQKTKEMKNAKPAARRNVQSMHKWESTRDNEM
jgi:hypothetical protein